MALVLRGSGGGVRAALHQPVREQSSGAVLRGVSHTLVPVRALPLHPAGGVRRPVGGLLHPGQHRLVPSPQVHALRYAHDVCISVSVLVTFIHLD